MKDLSNSAVCQLMSPLEVSARTGLVLLDVRSPIEFESEHIPGSVNIPLDQLEARCEEVPRKGQLVVICRSGKRAQRGSYALLGKGFQPGVLQGGLLAWRKSGLPVEEGKKMLPIERQIQLIVGVGVLAGVLLGAFVNPWFLVVPAFFGAGLTFAGASGSCALGILLAKAPWNQLPVVLCTNDSGSESPKPKSGCCS